jgi:HEAT repeat protein
MISTTVASLLLLAAPQVPGTPPASAAKQPTDTSKFARPAPGQKKTRKRRQLRNLDIIANAEMLPGDSLAVMSMAPIGKHRVDLMKTGVDDILRFVGPAWKSSDLLSWTALTPFDINSLTLSGFSLAISDVDISGETTTLRWILIAPTNQAAKMRNGLVESHKAHEDRGCELKVRAVGGDKAWTVTGPDGKTVSYMITEDSVLIGDSYASIRGAVHQLEDVDSSFAASGSYMRYVRKCSEEGMPLLTLLIQPQPVLEMAINLLPNANAKKTVRAIAERLELDRISELGISFFAKDGQVRDFTWLGYPSPRTGLLAALIDSGTQVNVNQLKVVAPDAVSASLFTINPKNVYAQALDLAGLLHPSVLKLLESTLSKIEPQTKLNLQRDILPLLGSHGVLQEWLPEGHTRACSLSIELQDTNAMRSALNKIASGLKLESVMIDSVPTLVIPGGWNPDSTTLLTVHGKTLILASTRRSIKNVVMMLESGIAGHTHRLASLIDNGSIAQYFAWGDCANISRHWLRTVSTFAGHRLLAHDLDQVVRARGGSIVSSVKTDSDGISSRTQSPFGNLYLTLAAAYLVKMSEFEGDSESAVLARRRSIVRDIIAAQHDFQRRAYRDVDGDKVGEFATIEELLARGLVSSRWFAKTGTVPHSAIGYQFQIFKPVSVDDQEKGFLLLAWPSLRSSGDAYAATVDGSIYRNEIIGQTMNLKSCDPRDFFAEGKFGSEVLPSWELIETSMVSSLIADTVTENRELTPEEKQALDALDAAEDSGAVTPKIVALLNSQSPFIVARAAHLLGKFRHKKAVPLLCEKLRGHVNTEVKRQAMAALCKIRDPKSIEASIDALSSTDSTVRTWAAQNLGYLHAKSAMPRLLDVLAVDPNPDAPDRIAALLALADIGHADCLVPAAVRVKGIGKKDDKAIVYLFQTLSHKLPPEVEAETLMAILDDDSQLLRRFAIQRLGVLQLPMAEVALRERLDKETALRALIGVSLQSIAQGKTSERLKGYVTKAAAQGTELWNSLSAHVAYGIGGGLLLITILWRRIARRRQLTRDGERVVAMVAPSDGFGYDGEEYEGEDVAEYDDEEYDDGEYDEGNAFFEDEYVGDDEDDGAPIDPAPEADQAECDAGYYGKADEDRYYGDDPLDEFYVDDEIIVE